MTTKLIFRICLNYPTEQFFAERGVIYTAQPLESITIRFEDGTVTTQRSAPHGSLILLHPDVQQYFPDAEAVNQTLRALIHLIPHPHLKEPV
jgi:hypothetical protein